jgi:hypothetical protein
MLSFQSISKGLMEQTIHKQCIVKIYRGERLINTCDVKTLKKKQKYIEQKKENFKIQ